MYIYGEAKTRVRVGVRMRKVVDGGVEILLLLVGASEVFLASLSLSTGAKFWQIRGLTI